MAGFVQFDPKRVSVILGVIAARAFADGEMINVEFEVDKRSKHIGTTGDGRHIKSANASGICTVRLANFSPTNAVIQALDALDEPFPITITDKSSLADLFFSPNCQLQKDPPLVKSDAAVNNEYIFSFISGKIVHSGAQEL